jgi:hypothetical protein
VLRSHQARTYIGWPAYSWAFVGQPGSLIWLTYMADPNGNSTIEKIAGDTRGGLCAAGSVKQNMTAKELR